MDLRILPAADGEEGTLHRPAHADLEWDVNAEVQVRALIPPGLGAVLPRDALELIAELTRRFGRRREELLEARGRFHRAIADGKSPGYLPETREIRARRWTVAPPPRDLRDRRVEITGPTDRKTVINALNSGACVYMADFEDAHAPVWEQTLRGQANLVDAVQQTIEWSAEGGRTYRLNREVATLLVRPRGWHLLERAVTVDGGPVPAALFDAGLFLYHNAVELRRRGSGPYLYLPKLEHHEEAALWSEVFDVVERRLGLPPHAIRAAVLIETLPAVFEMDEILYALRDRSLGLNGGRWDYIFSTIKQFRDDPRHVYPDRSSLVMTAPFLDAYARLLLRACHRRGAQAIGGMAAQVPIRGDPVANAAALEMVRADKRRERALGYDGTWVAHPALVPVALEVFDHPVVRPRSARGMAGIGARPPARLLSVPPGAITPEGVRSNVAVALRYLSEWLAGRGCVAIEHRMEDAATVEIARALLWQWVRHAAVMSNGHPVSAPMVRQLLADEAARLHHELPPGSPARATVATAAALLDDLVTAREFADFLTVRAGDLLMARGG